MAATSVPEAVDSGTPLIIERPSAALFLPDGIDLNTVSISARAESWAIYDRLLNLPGWEEVENDGYRWARNGCSTQRHAITVFPPFHSRESEVAGDE